MTETITIFQALAAVMGDVQGVKKADKNTSPSGGFMFRGIDAVTNAVGPALRRHGVIVVPEVLEKTYGTILSGQKQTPMSHAQLTIRFTWYGPKGDSIVSVVAGEAFDSGDKATAKAHSVAFRTAMIQTLCLPTDEPDADAESYQRSATSSGVAADWYARLGQAASTRNRALAQTLYREAKAADDVAALEAATELGTTLTAQATAVVIEDAVRHAKATEPDEARQ